MPRSISGCRNALMPARTLARVRSILPRRAGSHCRLRNVSRYASSYPAIWLPVNMTTSGRAASSDASISRMVSLETFGPSCMSASCNTRNLPERWNWRRPRRAEMDTGRSSSGPLADAGAAIWLKSVITHSVVHTTLTVPDSTMACLERAGTLNYGLKSPFLAIPRVKSPF